MRFFDLVESFSNIKFNKIAKFYTCFFKIVKQIMGKFCLKDTDFYNKLTSKNNDLLEGDMEWIMLFLCRLAYQLGLVKVLVLFFRLNQILGQNK
ncbi:hypothetical protein BpHYR1_038872 [Brachionus plicatilis]|uniref:Uncharacterized protein n=1 Tax=Brachionus plicatilis TaxID=10195 RepID=A0A3M7R6H0_BRAPC|nr:hypothetical protein BpHYR1_038872 [Brachionus plicatilis]